MKLFRRFLLAFGLALALGLPGSAAFAQQIIVIVNGAPITAYDVAQRIKLHQVIGGKAPSQKEVLDELIDERLKVQQGARLGIEVDDKDLDRIFASVAERTGRTPQQLTAGLASQGLDVQTFKNKLRADNVWQQYVRARSPSVNVREQDVLAELNRKGTTELVSTEYKLYPIIFVVPRGSNAYQARLGEANALRARFTNCESGLASVKSLREVVVRSPVLRLSSDMPAALRQVLDKTEVGRLTPPEVSQSGVEIFAVCGKSEVKGESAAKREVKEELANAQFQAESKKLVQELRAGAMIVYKR